MKKNLSLTVACVLALTASNAYAQYYKQGQPVKPTYQVQRYRAPQMYGQQVPYHQQTAYNQQTTSQIYGLRPYIGVDYIYSMFHFKSDTDEWFADKYNNLNLSVGLKMYQNFGIEASVQLSDKQEKTEEGYYNGLIPADVKTEISYNAYSIDAVGFLPVSPVFDFIGTFGAGIYVFDESGKITRISNGQVLEEVSDKKTRFAPRLGIGAELHLNDSISARFLARGAYLHYDDLDYIIDMQAGLRYYFN